MITDMVYMANAMRLAVATTNRDLCFFDAASGQLCNRVVGFTDIITSIDYASSTTNHDDGVLVFGDQGG